MNNTQADVVSAPVVILCPKRRPKSELGRLHSPRASTITTIDALNIAPAPATATATTAVTNTTAPSSTTY